MKVTSFLLKIMFDSVLNKYYPIFKPKQFSLNISYLIESENERVIVRKRRMLELTGKIRS